FLRKKKERYQNKGPSKAIPLRTHIRKSLHGKRRQKPRRPGTCTRESPGTSRLQSRNWKHHCSALPNSSLLVGPKACSRRATAKSPHFRPLSIQSSFGN